MQQHKPNWHPSLAASARICSDHFAPEDFDRTHEVTKMRKNVNPSMVKSLAKQIITEHNYHVTCSPASLTRQLQKAREHSRQQKRRLNVLFQRVRRMKRKMQSLGQIINDLKCKNKISERGADMLSSTINDIPADIMQRLKEQNEAGHLMRKKYSGAIRKFALTLSFYSSKAYNYVRETFKLALPHPSMLQTWYRSVSGEPGFTKESFEVLRKHSDKAREKGKRLLCNLTMDEMAIKKHVEWDGHRFRGYVDIGTGVDDDSVPAATEALVFMLVALDGAWKLPCAYFLLDGLNAKDRANLVTECLTRLQAIGVYVTSITCDGPACNLSMFSELGVSLTPNDMKCWFPHPTEKNHKVFALLDVCHMLKLARNTFATRIMKDENGDDIKWEYIERLHQLQQREGLRAGNRLKTTHIQWEKQKMKVNLAAQVISSSVADSLEFCRKLGLTEFAGSEPTIRFIRTIDHLFDILNSRNPAARYYKAPMKMNNKQLWQPFLATARCYISTLTDSNGTRMTATNRKTAFIGN